MEPKNANVLLGLADVEERLGTDDSLEEAKRYTERRGTRARERADPAALERLRTLTLEYTPDDPIDALVVESERVYQGRDALKPDAIKAEQIIRGGLEEHGLDPRLVRQIARLLLFTNRYDEAVEITARGLEANPDSEIMQELAKRSRPAACWIS